MERERVMLLQDAQQLVAKYRMPAELSGPLQSTSRARVLVLDTFGAGVGKLGAADTELWASLDVAGIRIFDTSLVQCEGVNALHARRAYLELVCQLSACAACRWSENLESLWWPSVLQVQDSTTFQLKHHQLAGSAPKFSLALKWPTPDAVQRLFSFLAMNPKELLRTEDWERLGALHGSTSSACWQTVELCLDISRCTIMTSGLSSIVENLRSLFAQRAQAKLAPEDDASSRRIDYQVTTLWWENCRLLSTPENLRLLAELVTLPSSTIHSLTLAGADFEETSTSRSLTRRSSARRSSTLAGFARRVLAPASPLRTLDLTRTRLNSRSVASICSMLRYGSHLTRLSIAHAISHPHGDARLVWAWLILGVLHADSSSELQDLDVSALVLRENELEGLMAMLDSPHPGRDLVLVQDGALPEGDGCDEWPLPAGQQLFVCLLVDAKVWAKPSSAVPWVDALADEEVLESFEYEVLVRLADWLCILIPGHGYGWVTSSTVRCESLRPSLALTTTTTKTHPELRSLALYDFMGLGTGVLGLAGLVGHQLESLDAPSCHLDTHALGVIVASCPRLSRLNLANNALTDLAPLLRAYEEQHCQLESLNVLVESMNASVVAQLCALLVHPHAKCLQSLQLASFMETDDDEYVRCKWTELTRALQSNSTLSFLGLTLTPKQTHDAAAALLKPLHGQVLRFETPSRLKTAFLSVVQHPTSSRGLRSLDRMALTTIFRFAVAHAVRREIHLRR